MSSDRTCPLQHRQGVLSVVLPADSERTPWTAQFSHPANICGERKEINSNARDRHADGAQPPAIGQRRSTCACQPICFEKRLRQSARAHRRQPMGTGGGGEEARSGRPTFTVDIDLGSAGPWRGQLPRAGAGGGEGTMFLACRAVSSSSQPRNSGMPHFRPRSDRRSSRSPSPPSPCLIAI